MCVRECVHACVCPSHCVLRENSALVDHLWLRATLFYNANAVVRGEPLCTVGTEPLRAGVRKTGSVVAFM